VTRRPVADRARRTPAWLRNCGTRHAASSRGAGVGCFRSHAGRGDRAGAAVGNQDIPVTSREDARTGRNYPPK